MGLGNLQPVAAEPSTNAANRRKNRRVEIFVVKGAGREEHLGRGPREDREALQAREEDREEGRAGRPEPRRKPRSSRMEPKAES